MSNQSLKRTVPGQALAGVIENRKDIKDFVINWSRRGGKSHFAIHDIMLPAALYIENCRIAYITSTLRHAKDIMWLQIIDAVGAKLDKKATNKAEGRIGVKNELKGTSIIQLMGWQTIDTIRGTANDIVIYDETQLLGDFYSNHNTAVMPTMATTKGIRFYLFTPLGFNHAYELSETAKVTDSWHYAEATWDKFKHIDAEFIANEEARMMPNEFGQEYNCLFVKPDGLVLDAFNNDIHVFKDEIRGERKKTICGVDFGYGKGNTAILKAEITKREDGKDVYWITEEVYKRGADLQTYQIAELLAAMKPDIIYADSADPERPKDLARTGLPVYPMKKFNGYKAPLIARVNQAIKQDRVFIKAENKNVLSEINMWFWDTKSSDIIRPDKSTKHDAIDALLYLIGSNEESVSPDKVINKPKRSIQRYNPIGI